MLRKTTAIALALISLAVGIHFVFGSLYGDDWFMAAGILVALIVLERSGQGRSRRFGYAPVEGEPAR